MLFLLKIGHVTLDGASNNNTMLAHLKNLLDGRGIPTGFDPIDNWVHTIDLGCKVVVRKGPMIQNSRATIMIKFATLLPLLSR